MYTTGTAIIDKSGAVIIPPTIGEAMRRITSNPAPLPHVKRFIEIPSCQKLRFLRRPTDSPAPLRGVRGTIDIE